MVGSSIFDRFETMKNIKISYIELYSTVNSMGSSSFEHFKISMENNEN